MTGRPPDTVLMLPRHCDPATLEQTLHQIAHELAEAGIGRRGLVWLFGDGAPSPELHQVVRNMSLIVRVEWRTEADRLRLEQAALAILEGAD